MNTLGMIEEKSPAQYAGLDHSSRLNLTLTGCSSAEPDSVSVQQCKIQFTNLYLQPVKIVSHLPTYSLSEKSMEILSDNPFQFLRNSSLERKNTLLRNEYLFIESLTTQNIATYWQYLENIIPGNKTIETIADILVIDSEKKEKLIIYNQIINSIIQADKDRFGLDKKLFESFFSQIQKKISNRRLKFLREKSSHPFLNYLLDQYLTPFTKKDFKNNHAFHIRTLREAYAQRNSMLHTGIVHDKSTIQLTGTLPKLIRRLRILLFNGIKNKVGHNHSEIVEILREQGRVMWN